MQAIPPARPRAAPAAAVAASAHATNETSAEATHVPETSGASTVLEAMFVGCSAGSFLGGYSAWTALPTTVAAAEVAALSAAPGGALAISTIGAAAGIGCGLGAATGVVTLAAASAWSWAMH